MVQFILVNDFKALNHDNSCQIVDVREEREYLSVRIPRSILVPLSQFENKLNLVDKDKPIYFLCGIGKRAQKAAEFLESNGWTNLFVIEGGLKAWIEAGYPVECG